MQGFRIGVRLSTEGSSGEVVDDWEVILGVRSGALLKLLVREQICMQLLVDTTQGLGSFTVHSQLETKMAASCLLGLLGLFLPRVGLKELPLAFKSYSGCYHFSEARPPPELFTSGVRSQCGQNNIIALSIMTCVGVQRNTGLLHIISRERRQQQLAQVFYDRYP